VLYCLITDCIITLVKKQCADSNNVQYVVKISSCPGFATDFALLSVCYCFKSSTVCCCLAGAYGIQVRMLVAH